MNLRDKFLNSLTRYLAVNESNNLPNTSTTTQAKTKPNALKSYDEYESHEEYPAEYNITGSLQATSSTIPLSDYDDLLPDERKFDLNLTAPQADANFTSIVSAEAPMSNNTQQGDDTDETLENYIIRTPLDGFEEGANLTAQEKANILMKYISSIQAPYFANPADPFNTSNAENYYSVKTSRRIAEKLNKTVPVYPEDSLPLITVQGTEPVYDCRAITEYIDYYIIGVQPTEKMNFPVTAVSQNATNNATGGNFGVRSIKPSPQNKLYLLKDERVYGDTNVFAYNPNGNRKVTVQSTIKEPVLIQSFQEVQNIIRDRKTSQPNRHAIVIYNGPKNSLMNSFVKAFNDTNIPTFTDKNSGYKKGRLIYFTKRFPTLQLDENNCPKSIGTGIDRISTLTLPPGASSRYLIIKDFDDNPSKRANYGVSYYVMQQNRRAGQTIYFMRDNHTYAFVDVTMKRDGMKISARPNSLDAITPTHIDCKYARFFNQDRPYKVIVEPLSLFLTDTDTMEFKVQQHGEKERVICSVTLNLNPVGMRLNGFDPKFNSTQKPDPKAKNFIVTDFEAKYKSNVIFDEIYTDGEYPYQRENAPTKTPASSPTSSPRPLAG